MTDDARRTGAQILWECLVREHEALPERAGPAMLRRPARNSPRKTLRNTIGAVAKWSGSGLQIRYTSVRIRSAPPPRIRALRARRGLSPNRAKGAAVCTPLDEATLEAAIASVTRALAATNDPQLAGELVAERRAMREELGELRQVGTSVVHLDAVRRRRQR